LILAQKGRHQISAAITIFSLTVATLLYGVLPVPVLPADLIIIFFLLIMVSIVPYLTYDLNKEKQLIFGWIAIITLSGIFGFITVLLKLNRIEEYANFGEVFIDEIMMNFGFLGALFFMHIMIYRFRKNNLALEDKINDSNARLNKELMAVEEQQKLISAQNAELELFQKELSSLNNKLEQTVRERTRELDMKNKELLKYAFMNSHLLRGPIARLRGLINIKQKIKQEELMSYFTETVRELQKTTTVIGEIVGKSNQHSIEEVESRVEQLYGKGHG
jgi:signal transduction histidine kinase